MSRNKNALIRYKILDKCFRNPGKKYFIEDLIRECEQVLLEIDPQSNGISRRQIFDDIAFMESSEGWNIELDKIRESRRIYYRYSDLSFSINNMPLNEVEIHQLKSALDILTQFKGMPQFEWIHELVPKLQQGIGDRSGKSGFMDFDYNRYLRGIEHLSTLYNAILYEKVLQIDYQSFENDNPFSLIIHPYYLKQFNNRWFLFGFFPELEKYDWNLAIDRIVKINEIQEEYRKNTQVDWDEYFEDMVGVTKPEGATPEKVVLLFFGKTGKYMETKPIHGSQRSQWLDGSTLEIKLDVIINYELERFILSYADSVKVLQPQSLQKVIAERLRKAQKLNED